MLSVAQVDELVIEALLVSNSASQEDFYLRSSKHSE